MLKNKKDKLKVVVVGTGCTWTKELSTSYIVNDDMLIDTPESTFKTLYHKYDLSKIKTVLFTHFHNDHFVCIHTIISIFCQYWPNQKITVVGPPGCKDKIITLLHLLEEDGDLPFVENNMTFITNKNGKQVDVNGYKITPYKVKHNTKDPFGYVIEKNDIKVGFSGDTAMCPGVTHILENCNTIFIDSSNVTKSERHLCLDEIYDLKEKYKNVKFYPIHFSDKSRKAIKHFKKLKSGAVIYIKK